MNVPGFTAERRSIKLIIALLWPSIRMSEGDRMQLFRSGQGFWIVPARLIGAFAAAATRMESGNVLPMRRPRENDEGLKVASFTCQRLCR